MVVKLRMLNINDMNINIEYDKNSDSHHYDSVYLNTVLGPSIMHILFDICWILYVRNRIN